MKNLYDFVISVSPDKLMAFMLAMLFSMEQLFSTVKLLFEKSKHLVGNIILQAGYMAVNFGLATAVVQCSDWTSENKFGLFNVVQLPYSLKVILGVLCIDMVNYWAHRLNHTWEPFWRLHRVHHSDTVMDSATTIRFHPLDALLDNLSSVVAVLLFGLDGSMLVFWWILYIPLFAFHHAKISLPTWFDRTFGRIIVSPNLHKIHHHQDQTYTDSNYGLLFIFWDKLFNTYKELPVNEIKYGLSEFDQPKRQTFWFLLISPFIQVKNQQK